MNSNLNTGNNDIVDSFLYIYLAKIAKYIPSKINPNLFTVIGFLGSCLTALSLIFIEHRIAFILAILGLVIWLVFDGLDGVHARNTNKSTLFGSFLDHYCDQLSMFILFFSVIMRFNLFAPIFIFIFLFRVTLGALVFVFQATYQILILPKLGLSFEILVYCVLFAITFLFGDLILFSFQLPNNTPVHLSLIKLVILFYLFFLPKTSFMYYKLAKAASKANNDAK